MHFKALQPEIAELRADVKLHFPCEPVPDHDGIVCCDCERCTILRDDLASKRWTNVSRKMIDEHFSSLSLLTPFAHRYYLPAYLVRALDSESHGWRTTVDFVIYDLCPEDSVSWSNRYSLFTPEQRRVVARWLEFVLSHPQEFNGDEVVGQRGFDLFWREYLPHVS